MVTVELKGIHTVKAKGRTYYYAWRGGPALKGQPGSDEFMASLSEARENAKVPDKKRFRSVVVRYKASQDYLTLADSTKRNWSPWLDKIADYFGELRITQFDRADKIKPVLRKWRGKYADKPRTADYGMQVLSRVLAYAVDPLGELGSNPCEGIKQLYSGSRAEIVWTDDDIAHLKKTCSKEIGYAVDLAAHTGLRAGDLVKLSWSHIGADMIVMKTGKRSGRGKKQKEAVIPLYAELRDLLARIPKRSTTIITNTKGMPWTVNRMSSAFADAKHKAWPEGDDLHFHDLRGTAATKFYLGGLSEREIAEIMAWDEDYVARIIRRYVSRTAAIQDRIKRLDEARQRG